MVIGKYANTRVRILYGAEDLGGEPLDGLSLAVIQQMRIPGAPYFHSISDSGFTDKEIEALRTWWNQNAHRFSANPRAIIPFEESVKHQEAQSQRRSQSIQTPESPAIAKPTATPSAAALGTQQSQAVRQWFVYAAIPGALIVALLAFCYFSRNKR